MLLLTALYLTGDADDTRLMPVAATQVQPVTAAPCGSACASACACDCEPHGILARWLHRNRCPDQCQSSRDCCSPCKTPCRQTCAPCRQPCKPCRQPCCKPCPQPC